MTAEIELPHRFKQFFSHWQSLRKRPAMPDLSAFLDRPLPAVQPWVSIFDVNDTGLVLRLFGTGMVQFTGVDLTGKTLDDYAAPEGRAGVAQPYHHIVRKPCGSLTSSLWATSTGRNVEIWSIGLPLIRKGGASAVWLTEPTVGLVSGETGVIVRRLVSKKWIDLGCGIPDGD
jgi:hypothetical protein